MFVLFAIKQRIKILPEQQTSELIFDYMFSHRNFSFYGGHEDEINSLVFSHDLQILLTGSIDGCIRLWNTVCHRLTLKIQEQRGRENNNLH
jgi:WD40 repeat protein